MVSDVIKASNKRAREATPSQIVDTLTQAKTDSAARLVGYLRQNDEILEDLSKYWSVRSLDSDALLNLMRTQDQAVSDYSELTSEIHQSYGVKMEGYHNSPKALVNTVDAITTAAKKYLDVSVDLNPQSRAVVVSDDHIWVSPRRLDGAIPSLLNPVALWEIKEYWGVTSGGSKMSDAVYEIQLVGSELRTFEEKFGIHVNHYAILDGRQQWTARKSDLRRMVDLLHSGILDELVVGSEVLTEWPRIVRSNFDRIHKKNT